MMYEFLRRNRDELIARCKEKVAQRPAREATTEQLSNGIPLFLDQLERTLAAEEGQDDAESLRISGPAGGDLRTLSEMGVSASAHGKQLMELGFTVNQVVHDYGDLCQAITDLAVERDAPFGISEFRTLNRCLDNAIAGAVTEFSYQRDLVLLRERDAITDQRVGALVHELRNALSNATLSVAALDAAGLPVSGATGGVLKRALTTMTHLINASIEEIRHNVAGDGREVFAVKDLIANAADGCSLYAIASGNTLAVGAVHPDLNVLADRERLLGALAHLLQNALKFTKIGTQVSLTVSATADLIVIEIGDHCGGLAADSVERMFSPFTQRNSDRSGLGLGLTIARQSVESDGGTLTVRNLPGVGCVFTMSLPRHNDMRRADPP